LAVYRIKHLNSLTNDEVTLQIAVTSSLNNKCSPPLLIPALSKACILSEQFKSVFARDEPQSADKKLPGFGYPTILSLTIDTTGLTKLLHKMSPHKASRPHEKPGRLLQAS